MTPKEKTFKRKSGRKFNEMRKMSAEVGVIANADGSARFSWTGPDGKMTNAIAAVYGPKKMHPQHLQDPEKGTLRCTYNMMSFSVEDRIRPGPNRRSTEISKIIQWALEPVLMIDKYSNMVIDVHMNIMDANASTRCAAINAAAMALAHAGIPMKDIVSSVSIGKLDKDLVVDVDKYEDSVFDDGEGASDIPMTFTSNGEMTHIQIDGNIDKKQLMEAVALAQEACKEIYEVQKKALKEVVK